jgi:hypothetical protein
MLAECAASAISTPGEARDDNKIEDVRQQVADAKRRTEHLSSSS